MTDWESRYQTKDMPWEKGYAAPPLTELLGKTDVSGWGTGPILVPGCGLGHDARVLGALGIPVVGVDLSPTAIGQAREFEGSGYESYEVGDFLDLGWRAGRGFSAIWEHTCFCAIDPSDRDRYAQAAAACLGAGGLLAGVFFLTPHDAGDAGEGPPFGTSVEEVRRRLAPWFEPLGGWVPETGYPGREGREWIGLFRNLADV